MSSPHIERQPGLAAVTELLKAASLPCSDLTEAHMQHFFVTGSNSAPAGVVGLEFFGPDALLRSLAVVPGEQGAGVGSALVAHAEHYSRSRGVRSIFLLTTTAENFFKARGYAPADRATAPDAIRASREFADLCPASSAFLVKHLS